MPGEPVSNVTKCNLTNKKIMLCNFCSVCCGIIHKEYLDGKTLECRTYSEMLVHVEAVIKEKQTEFWQKQVMFHKDNVKPHVSALRSWTLYVL